MEVMEHPTAGIIARTLAEIDPARSDEWTEGFHGDRRLVTVNGLPVPIVRIAWNKVDEFFDRLFDRADATFFGGRLPPCRMTWNPRLRTVAGRIYCPNRLIELSAAHYEACGLGAMGVVLIHEMIHYHLYVAHRPSGHSREFKSVSRSLGLPEVHHELPLPDRLARQHPTHVYACPNGHVVESRKRFRVPRACGECCKKFSKGKYDERFRLVPARNVSRRRRVL